MWNLFEIAVDFAVELCSWRLWICILLAIGIVAGAYYQFPENQGYWHLTSPIALIVLAFGGWWEWRSSGWK